MAAFAEETEDRLAALLQESKTIAVVGAKAGEHEDAYRIPLYMQQAGYRVLPVNPKLERVLGEDCRPSLREVQAAFERGEHGKVDIVNLFRASEHVPAHVDEILALDPKPLAVWMQLGIQNGEAAERLRAAGISVIQDRCIMVDHRRLLSADT